jgi:hypothetical protein
MSFRIEYVSEVRSALGVVRHESLRHLEGVSLVRVYSILALHCLSPRFSICHPEYVVRLDSPIHSTVAWDGFS